jgi:protein-disulfide isomerase
VTVEEFADYQCPTCATVHPMTQELTKIYGNRIKFIYRNFPLQQIHRYAYDAAVAAEAASLQGQILGNAEPAFSESTRVVERGGRAQVI